ncbi:MAG: NAD(P)-dependent alcohol dehydrogenase [bacterium]|nr:NAD(P)-dependent alcohol dehydrogenase [bacterium]
MKAMIYTKYGSPDVLELKEIEKPAPGDNEVRIKIFATSLNAFDWRYLRGKPFLLRLMAGFPKPRNQILGIDIAGQVEAVGKNATQFKPGDDVYADISGWRFGGFAQYVCADEKIVAFKPGNITFEEAAAVPMAAVTALQGLRDHGGIQAGQKVLINGASGGVGTFAIQIAKAFGAEVTAVCSTGKLDMVRSLGADHVIDYTKENFTENGQLYDLILAANGYHPIWDYKRALSPKGTYIMAGGTMTQMMQGNILGPMMSKAGGKKLGAFEAKPKQKDLDYIKVLIETGKVVPVIDKLYSLSEVAEAIRYLEDGHAKGKIVITVEHENNT